MDYQLTEQQLAIVDAAERICAKFPPEYWLEREGMSRSMLRSGKRRCPP